MGKRHFVLWGLALLASCSSGSGLSAAPPRRDAGAGVALQRIRLVLQDLELRARDGSLRAPIASAPVIVELAGGELEGGVHPVLDAEAPKGTYDELAFRIRPPAGVPDGAQMPALSIVIEGSFQGRPFQLAAALEADQRLQGQFVADSNGRNLTINVDPSGWFVSGAKVLDPFESSDRALIAANVGSSLSAFQDDDELGYENQDDGVPPPG
ncbi:MAG TPA: hypothetical protein VE964_04775 [Myxococcales bacterium]|nr:hypothetical protein [Myxococcales bacterium]